MRGFQHEILHVSGDFSFIPTARTLSCLGPSPAASPVTRSSPLCASPLNGIIDRLRPRQYGRKSPSSPDQWARRAGRVVVPQPEVLGAGFFEVHSPNILAYEGEALHRKDLRQRADHGRLPRRPAPHLPRSVRPDPAVSPGLQQPGREGRGRVRRPIPGTGLPARAPLPIGHGRQGAAADHRGGRGSRCHMRWSRACSTSRGRADREMLRYYKSKFSQPAVEDGILKTVRGTLDHTVRERLRDVKCPTLLVTGVGRQDLLPDRPPKKRPTTCLSGTS